MAAKHVLIEEVHRNVDSLRASVVAGAPWLGLRMVQEVGSQSVPLEGVVRMSEQTYVHRSDNPAPRVNVELSRKRGKLEASCK